MSGVLIDTCIWSLALRDKAPTAAAIAQQLLQLVDQHQVRIIGPIRQELLSGYTNKRSFDRLRQKMAHFPNEPILDADYEAAAEYSNFCRSKGVQGSHTDFLICAVSVRAAFRIYTVDKDFRHYAKHLPIDLLSG